jgi:hypothetical protein
MWAAFTLTVIVGVWKIESSDEIELGQNLGTPLSLLFTSELFLLG